MQGGSRPGTFLQQFGLAPSEGPSRKLKTHGQSMGCSNGCATIVRKPSGRVVPVAGSEATCTLLAPQGFSAWFEFQGPVGHLIINRRLQVVPGAQEAIMIMRQATCICISGLVVEYIVAIDVTRARFPADASMRWVALKVSRPETQQSCAPFVQMRVHPS